MFAIRLSLFAYLTLSFTPSLFAQTVAERLARLPKGSGIPQRQDVDTNAVREDFFRVFYAIGELSTEQEAEFTRALVWLARHQQSDPQLSTAWDIFSSYIGLNLDGVRQGATWDLYRGVLSFYLEAPPTDPDHLKEARASVGSLGLEAAMRDNNHGEFQRIAALYQKNKKTMPDRAAYNEWFSGWLVVSQSAIEVIPIGAWTHCFKTANSNPSPLKVGEIAAAQELQRNLIRHPKPRDLLQDMIHALRVDDESRWNEELWTALIQNLNNEEARQLQASAMEQAPSTKIERARKFFGRMAGALTSACKAAQSAAMSVW